MKQKKIDMSKYTLGIDPYDKQETLEEAAKNYTLDFATMSAFKLGAKYQAERMYSEEEVYNLLKEAMKDCYTYELDYHYLGDYKNLKKWFEQIKKK